jgi:two-component system chemotaxis response regulator CheB
MQHQLLRKLARLKVLVQLARFPLRKQAQKSITIQLSGICHRSMCSAYVTWITQPHLLCMLVDKGASLAFSAQTQTNGECSYGVVAIGGSAGGVEALTQILGHLPAAFRLPILVVQHLPSRGDSNLAVVLGRWTSLAVKWAEHGERPCGGTVYVAPINHHLTVTAEHKLHLCSLSERVNYFRPAVDPLFYSVARVFGARAIAIVLSGMLDDGSRGAAEVRRCGGVTMAQSEATSQFFDMPCAAMDYGGSELRFSPQKIAEALRAAA